jgi:hypothetical protein
MKNPSRRGGKSDAMIRREKLQQIAALGSTDGLNTRSVARFWEKGYLQESGGKITLTRRGAAVAAARIGAAGRGAVDFSEANREAGRAGGMNSPKGHAARAAALRGVGGMTKAQAHAYDAHQARAYDAHQAHHAPRKPKARADHEARALAKILGTFAVKIAPSDGGTFTREHLKDFHEDGWQIAAAGTAPARLGSRLPGARRDTYDGEPVWNPSDPLGPLHEARAVVLISPAPLDLETLFHLRSAGYDLSPAPMKQRTQPTKNPRNPSPGVMLHGPHASAEQRRAALRAEKKARAWFDNDDLVTEARVLKGFDFEKVAKSGFVKIGEILSITYGSHKYTGEHTAYVHDFTKKRALYLSNDGSTMVVWPPMQVTTRGIMG